MMTPRQSVLQRFRHWQTSTRNHWQWLATILVTMLFLAGADGGTPSTQAPTEIRHPAVDYPIWLSAEMAQADGALESSLFHPIAARRIRAIFESTPVHGCYQVGPMLADRYGGRTAPTSLTEASQAYPVLALGRVTNLSPGFLVGEPGTLISAETDVVSRAVTPGSRFFVFVPVGDFTFRGKRICKLDPRFAPLPKVGEEILLFSDETETVETQYFPVEYPENIAVISGDKVSYAKSLKAANNQTEALPTNRNNLLAALGLQAARAKKDTP
jgi:hypothetical protein